MKSASPELVVIMPVYNEEAAIAVVVAHWDQALTALGIDYRIRAYNDGSKDATAARLDALASTHPRLEVYHKTNSGHGPTILAGYRGAAESMWLFQIDSDDEMGPEGFAQLWHERNNFDFLIGRRQGRSSPWSRTLVSLTSRTIVRVLFGPGVYDVNSPYRLLRGGKFRGLFSALPDNTFAPNVIISGFACRHRLRILELPVPHQQRQTGEVSIKKWRLLKAAAKSCGQTIRFRFCSQSCRNT